MLKTGRLATLSRSAVLTLAYAFLIATLTAAFVATLLVPAWLPVEYLTPITLSGSPIGLLLGSIIVFYRAETTGRSMKLAAPSE
jgi:hypothetical protein